MLCLIVLGLDCCVDAYHNIISWYVIWSDLINFWTHECVHTSSVRLICAFGYSINVFIKVIHKIIYSPCVRFIHLTYSTYLEFSIIWSKNLWCSILYNRKTYFTFVKNNCLMIFMEFLLSWPFKSIRCFLRRNSWLQCLRSSLIHTLFTIPLVI